MIWWLLAGCCPDRCPEVRAAVAGCAAWDDTPWGTAEGFDAWCPAWRDEVGEVAQVRGRSSCDERFSEVVGLSCDELVTWTWTASDTPP